MWNLSLYIVTWNVSTKYPDNIKLNELLEIDLHNKEKRLPDFYIVGLQEVNANPHSYVSSFFKSDPWVQKLKELLKPLDYIVAKTEQMQGLLLTIFVKRKHLYHIREIESEYVRTGFGGMWGNKGAVATRMNCYGCSICLVNSHLAAHDEMLEERINDYQRVKEATNFSVKFCKDIYDHDYVFWFGDLNFRLYNHYSGSDNYTPQEIRQMIKEDRLAELIKKDQLSLAMCEGRAFSELVERLPQFPPTFKFVVDSNDYDMKRRPAWCDRILYKARSKIIKNCSLHLEQVSYKSHPNYDMSDHKPVSSEFRINSPEDDISELVIKFKPLTVWNNSEDNEVEYILPPNFVCGSADWIGVYPENFTGFDEYYGYEYTETAGDKPEPRERTIKINFSASIDLPLKGNFVFLYFQSTGMRGYSSMLGVSDPFPVIKRCPSPRPDTID
ncbi:inositol polyphosphate 5-phosphatase K-like isoform X2 [Chironomus tepperi]|uniref:inositol polyphosphate 5-phosphatase K-like isoform X2 n=1 Tax=Chironomus tepperi TaxID=113505 RepID=UPI00391F2AFF